MLPYNRYSYFWFRFKYQGTLQCAPVVSIFYNDLFLIHKKKGALQCAPILIEHPYGYSFNYFDAYFAKEVALFSRITVTLICPG